MYKDSSKRLTGNEVFEGFAVDLIHEVAQILSMILKKNLYCQFGILNCYLNFFPEFNYSFKWVDDQKYGKREKETGEWNGMMGELLAQVIMNLEKKRISN